MPTFAFFKKSEAGGFRQENDFEAKEKIYLSKPRGSWARTQFFNRKPCHHTPLKTSKLKYELVLHNAEHSTFTEKALLAEKERSNPNHNRAIIALSTAFWDAWLKDDYICSE